MIMRAYHTKIRPPCIVHFAAKCPVNVTLSKQIEEKSEKTWQFFFFLKILLYFCTLKDKHLFINKQTKRERL